MRTTSNQRRTRTCDAGFKIRQEGQEKRIEGYFAVFGPEYEIFPGAFESVDPHAFDEALGDDVRALIDHDTRLVLGRTAAGTLTLRADETGLWGSVLVNESDQDAMNLFARVQRGDVSQCSFGFDILDETPPENRADGTVHWTIRKVKLYEVSVCTFPAYQDTGVEARRADFESARRRQLDAWKQSVLKKIRK